MPALKTRSAIPTVFFFISFLHKFLFGRPRGERLLISWTTLLEILELRLAIYTHISEQKAWKINGCSGECPYIQQLKKRKKKKLNTALSWSTILLSFKKRLVFLLINPTLWRNIRRRGTEMRLPYFFPSDLAIYPDPWRHRRESIVPQNPSEC